MIFMGNMCGGHGGAVDLSDVDIGIYGNMVFSSNSAASSGGALYASQKVFGPELTGVVCFNNTAEAGGAVFFSAVGTDEYDSSDNDNSPYIYASKFIECRFDGNSASSTGGAIYSIAGKTLVRATNFINNSAFFGGTLRISGTTFIFNSSFFVKNKSGEEGGAAISTSGINSTEKLFFAGNGYHCSADAFFMDWSDLGFTS